MRVVQGLPITWDSVLATVYHEDYWRRVAWSPCNKFTAVAGDSTIEILDATTLEKLNTFCSRGCSFQQLGFSSDGCTLIHFSDWGITSWDLQTGVPVSSVHPENLVLGSKTSLSFAHSIDGKILAVSTPSPSPLDNDPILGRTHNSTIINIMISSLGPIHVIILLQKGASYPKFGQMVNIFVLSLSGRFHQLVESYIHVGVYTRNDPTSPCT